MTKSLFIYIASFTAMFFVLHFAQQGLFQMFNAEVRFNTWDVNMFLAIVSLLICVHLKLFANIKMLHTQIGFIYLPTLFIKGGLFYVAFKTSIFNIEILTSPERYSLLVPVLLFLGLEVFFVVKILEEIDA
ncbi:DUF6168 family protein [Winogradskyella arenosi]|uniref:Uncharacterized protein n=1 Tax=Winogradskyella arenosi TaxID=533325 RepID=A0A368ZJD6_9FLAO|nr:DUF6168 family protein [Winogradskyella arenosi]RCW93538.1 hypothetical protein DFQ08_101333 [Winogradskyella arenosi]